MVNGSSPYRSRTVKLSVIRCLQTKTLDNSMLSSGYIVI